MAAYSPAGFPTFSQTLRHRAPLPRPTSRGTRREGKGAATHQPQPSTSTSRSYRPSAFGHCIPLPLHPVARSASAAQPPHRLQHQHPLGDLNMQPRLLYYYVKLSLLTTHVSLTILSRTTKAVILIVTGTLFFKKNTVWCQGDYVRICIAASLSWL